MRVYLEENRGKERAGSFELRVNSSASATPNRPRETPAAEVLIEAEEGGNKFPVVVAARFGAGRVVSVMTDSVWHWRMGAKTWSAERSPYDVFWSQLMEWLIPKEQDKQGVAKLELVTERPAYTLGEQPEVRAVNIPGTLGSTAAT